MADSYFAKWEIIRVQVKRYQSIKEKAEYYEFADPTEKRITVNSYSVLTDSVLA